MIRVPSGSSALSVSTEKFLLEVGKMPCLWNPGHREYNNQTTRRVAFRLIAENLVQDDFPKNQLDQVGHFLSIKWKQIRHYWIKAKLKPSNAKCEDNQYFKMLKFLEPTLASEVLKQQDAKGSTSGESIRCTSVKSSPSKSVTSSQDEEDAKQCRQSVAKRKRNRSYGSQDNTGVKVSPVGVPKDTSTNVFIDGVEFERVTLESGEVVVKLKGEVLDSQPCKRKETKKRSVADQQNADGTVPRKKVDLAMKARHSVPDGGSPEDKKPSIARLERRRSVDIVSTPKKVTVDLASVEGLKRLVQLPPMSDAPKLQPVIKNEPVEEPIEISDDEPEDVPIAPSDAKSATVAAQPGATTDGNSPKCLSTAKQQSTTQHGQPTLAALPVTGNNDAQRHQTPLLKSTHSLSESPAQEPIEIVDNEPPPEATSKSPEDEIDEANKKFLIGLLPEMREMTDTQNYEFRLEVMQALAKAMYY